MTSVYFRTDEPIANLLVCLENIDVQELHIDPDELRVYRPTTPEEDKH